MKFACYPNHKVDRAKVRAFHESFRALRPSRVYAQFSERAQPISDEIRENFGVGAPSYKVDEAEVRAMQERAQARG